MTTVSTNPELLDRLIHLARNYKMTPAEIRRQRVSFIRSGTGLSTEEILRIMPHLAEGDGGTEL